MRNHRSRFLQLGIRRTGLFGSYVTGQQTDDSDIDVLIDLNPEAETYDNFMLICDILEHLFEGKKIDVVTVNGLSRQLGLEILKEVQYV